MTSDPRLVLGVDAGNSKTVAVVADTDGRVLGSGRAGNGDIYGAVTEQAAVAAVVAAADAAMTAAYGRADHTRLGHAAFCLAGMDWSSDHEFWSARLEERYPGLSRTLHNDGFALLRAGEPGGRGVALSVGTGGAVVARGPEREWTASFWLRDPVGGSELGRAAFDAVVRADLGIDPPTCLTDTLLTRFGQADVEALLEAGTRRGGRPITYAVLARDVLDAAGRGDAVAQLIVGGQARSLARYARAATRRVGLDGAGTTVVLGGSVLSSENPVLRDATVAALADELPGASAVLSPRSPVVGAAAEAIAELRGSVSAAVATRLADHRFPPEFLLT
jgi:N-acetylglucosamine kinase-like BadF-type ATPase